MNYLEFHDNDVLVYFPFLRNNRRFRTGNQCHNSEEFNAFTLALAQHPALTSVNVSGALHPTLESHFFVPL